VIGEPLGVVPAQFRVIVTHRRGDGSGPAPERLIKGELATEGWSPTCWLSNTLGFSIISRIVQCNGYEAYKTMRDEPITLAFCCAQIARTVILFIACFLLVG
jgi:hypothetical protein